MPDTLIENPIINTPFEEPARHFRFTEDGITNEIVEERRVSAYFMPIARAKKGAQTQFETGWTADRLEENRFINRVRERVTLWRRGGRPDITPTTRRLLEYWTDPERERRLFFCSGEGYEQRILENLLKAGVQNRDRRQRLELDTLEPYPGTWINAHGEFTDEGGQTRRVGISLGPEYGTVGSEQVREAAKEAIRGLGFDLLLVCGFAFDAHGSEAASEFQPESSDGWAVAAEERKLGRLPVLLVRMNTDLTMGDELLKKTGAGNLFMVFGEPDVTIDRTAEGRVEVEVHGVDVYDPTTGEVRSDSTDEIACWFIDNNYNGESFFVRDAYFTGANDPYKRLKAALKADIDEDAWASLYRTRSRPFDPPETGTIAVKVINHHGDEVLKTYDLEAE